MEDHANIIKKTYKNVAVDILLKQTYQKKEKKWQRSGGVKKDGEEIEKELLPTVHLLSGWKSHKWTNDW